MRLLFSTCALCFVAYVLLASHETADAQITKNGSGTLYDNVSDPWVVAGEVTVGEGGTGNTMTVQGGSDVDSQSGRIAVFPGSDGTATIDGAGSTWTNNGSLIVGDFGVGALNVLNGAAVTSNDGIVSRFGDLSALGPSTVTIDGAGSSWDVSGNLVFGGTLASANAITFENAVADVQNGGNLSVDGTLKIWEEGKLDFAGGELEIGTLDLTAAGATGNFNFMSGDLSVDNVVGNLVQNGGVLTPGDSPGLTSIDGDYTFNNGTIEIELGGLNRVTQYDAIDVSGMALLNNVTIEVSFIDGFVAPTGPTENEFDIFDGILDPNSTVTFDFSNVPLDAPFYWDTSRFMSEGIIIAVPEPSGAVVLLMAGVLFARRKRTLAI